MVRSSLLFRSSIGPNATNDVALTPAGHVWLIKSLVFCPTVARAGSALVELFIGADTSLQNRVRHVSVPTTTDLQLGPLAMVLPAGQHLWGHNEDLITTINVWGFGADLVLNP